VKVIERKSPINNWKLRVRCKGSIEVNNNIDLACGSLLEIDARDLHYIIDAENPNSKIYGMRCSECKSFTVIDEKHLDDRLKRNAKSYY
jgi:hypothetical protein